MTLNGERHGDHDRPTVRRGREEARKPLEGGREGGREGRKECCGGCEAYERQDVRVRMTSLTKRTLGGKEGQREKRHEEGMEERQEGGREG